MKKCVLSAAVLAMLVPAIYAMDGAAEPVVEVEVPAVETHVEAEVEVTVASEEVPADDVKVEVEAVEVNDVVTFLPVEGIEGEVPEVAVCDIHPVEKITTDEMVEGEPEIAVCFEGDPSLMFRTGVIVEGGEGVEGGEPIMYMFGAPAEGGEPLTVEGGEVDPNLVDLASQSGIAIDDKVAEGEVTVTAIEDSPTRGGEGEIQPYYRSLTGALDGGGEPIVVNNFAGGLSGGIESQSGAPLTTASDLAEPQMLNDEQRGAVRGLRSEEESTKTRSGLGKFMAKFRKPKSEVTQASATVTDKSMSSKLAEIDRMRDTALRTGDQKALAKADKLEKELRAKAGTATRIPTRTK